MTTETAQVFDFVAFANEQSAELIELQEHARAAKRAADDKKKQIETELHAKLVGRYVIASGQYEAESRMFQDGFELDRSYRSFSDQTFVITYVFLSNEAYQFQAERLTPIIFARHEEVHGKYQPGGEVSFRLLKTTRFELVDA